MGTFVKRSNKVHVALILDESGSMGGLWDDTIGGVNSYFDTLKEDKETDYSVTIMKFDTEYRPLAENRPLSEIPRLDRSNYCPRGGTALYDAVGKVLKAVEPQVQQGEKAIVVILTDGEENSSHEHTERSIKPWIERLQGQGNWTFVYLGAVDNAWSNASRMGLSKGNTRRMMYSSQSIRANSAMLARATKSYACSNMDSTQDFYGQFAGESPDLLVDEDEEKDNK